MKKLLFSLLALPLLASAADIYMAGDSTMVKYQPKQAPMEGWGAMIQKHCLPGVTVHNRARGGRSAKSFITEKRWEQIMNSAKKGDFVIIQFGHNDAHRGEKNFYRHTEPADTYRYYLKIYIAEARAKGVTPILCTQTALGLVDKSGKFSNRGRVNEKYVAACREVAAETGCDFIDLNAWTYEKFAAMSKEEIQSHHMFVKPGEFANYPQGRNDSCHLSFKGADFYANAFVELAKKQNLPIAKLFK